jgi:hypothetical protein
VRADLNAGIVKEQMCFVEVLKYCRARHELGELWNVEYELIKEGYPNGFEPRGFDPGHEILQVLANPFEPKSSKSGEDGACRRGQSSVISARVGWRGFKINGERLEVDQHGQAGDDLVGWKVPGMGNIPKGEADEVSCGQKKFWKRRKWN